MSRTVTPFVLFAWVAATVMLAASCAKEERPAGRPGPADPVIDQTDVDDSADAPTDPFDVGAPPAEQDLDQPPAGTSDDPFADPDAMSGAEEEFGTDNHSPGPFDVPDDLFSEMDDLTDEHGEPSRRPDVHFVPTPQEVVDRMLELAEVTKDDVVYDLGCGDGRIVVTAAKRYGAKALGVDIDPQRVAESIKNVKDNNVDELVEIKEGDIFEMDLTPASVITLYLLPDLNVKLIPQLEKLKPGTRIVSHAFDMRGVKPDTVETVEAERGTSHTVYLWTTPLQKEDTTNMDDLF